ncbi:glycoprotein integral membrane protein 1 isoform X2 [Rana temporaria]|uniref:glycoprotein integral membrane protein 1 isoform X2 n=1 Tax=Rana temporaria TaxID=8407 RepID=UPI001AAE058A|nr:glycoprotein integral membrane protein 1 isoform X2 [Rana temporaria]
MERSTVRCIGPAWSCLPVVFLVFLLCDSQSIAGGAPFQELIRLNVTAQHDNKTVVEQVAFNISYERGQMQVNGFPLSKGVSRISCKTDKVDYGLPYEPLNVVHEALVSMRLLVLHWPMNSSTGETKIIVQQEVVEIDGNQVYQNVTEEMKLVVNRDMEVLQHMISTVTLKDTLLYSIPRTSDVLFTFPNIPQAVDRVPQETTRDYNVRQNTTMDEDPFSGKLPETPLQAVIPASSYKVMCQFADDLRENLCLIWNALYPVLINFIEVFIVGVIAAALVLQLLKLVYPSREHKGILQPSDLKDSALYVPLMLSPEEVTVKAQEAGNII